MMKENDKKNNAIISLLREKATHSPCTYKISAIAFDKYGDVLGHVTNSHSRFDILQQDPIGRPGTAIHAERRLCARYGSNIKTIVICRIGRSGNILPIDPCPTCRRVAKKLGAKIVSVLPGDGNEYFS